MNQENYTFCIQAFITFHLHIDVKYLMCARGLAIDLSYNYKALWEDMKKNYRVC